MSAAGKDAPPAPPAHRKDTSIAVSLVDLDNPAWAAPACLAWLQPDERARAARFRRSNDGRRFAAGRAALRLALGHHLDCDPGILALQTNPWGRPELAGGPFFNLTHAEGRALIAIDSAAPVGVDLEPADRALDPTWLDGILSARERKEAGASEEWLRLWVRKEAVLKALGRGLSYPVADVTVGFGPATEAWRPVAVRIEERVEWFMLRDLAILPDAVAALASRKSPVGVEIACLEPAVSTPPKCSRLPSSALVLANSADSCSD